MGIRIFGLALPLTTVYTQYIVKLITILKKINKIKMEETKKKIIDIDRDTFVSLSIIAAQKGKRLKNLIQDILIEYAEINGKPF